MPIRTPIPNIPRRRSTRDIIEGSNRALELTFRTNEGARGSFNSANSVERRMDFMGTNPPIPEVESLENIDNMKKNPLRKGQPREATMRTRRGTGLA